MCRLQRAVPSSVSLYLYIRYGEVTDIMRAEYIIDKYGRDKDQPPAAGKIDNLYCKTFSYFLKHLTDLRLNQTF